MVTIPTPGKPLSRAYYEDRHDDFVRADVTYLRQDFSLLQPVSEPGAWPCLQRYDYLVRNRELSEKEVNDGGLSGKGAASYPQREAVLFALRRLTGKDAGDSSADWCRLLLEGEAKEGP